MFSKTTTCCGYFFTLPQFCYFLCYFIYFCCFFVIIVLQLLRLCRYYRTYSVLEEIGEEDMRKFHKRLLTLLCCISLATGLAVTAAAASAEQCPGNCTHQAAIGTTHYDTLEECFAAATDGCTVTVLQDLSSPALSLDKAIILDLGGKTVTGQNGQDEFLLSTSKDFFIKNGTLTTENGICLLANSCNLIVDKTANLVATGKASALVVTNQAPVVMSLNSSDKLNVMINGRLTSAADGPTLGVVSNAATPYHLCIGKDAVITATGANAIEMHGNGKLEITGGTICAKKNAVVLNIFEKKTMEASITGGKFLVEKGETVAITQGTNATAPADFVIGGTYNKLPSKYIPTYCRVDANSDGTYTVTAEYAITFSANGASGTMTAVKADRGSSITLPVCGFTAPAGKHFVGWKIQNNIYSPGASYCVNGPVSLSAVWDSHVGGNATCSAKAVCSICGSSYGTYASHNLYHVSAYAATCSSSGMNSHSKCTTCGQLFVSGIPIRASSLTIPALGHRMTEVAGKDATCMEDGIAAYEKCEFCGILQLDGKTVSEEELVIPATGHDHSTVPAVEATCTQTGTKSHEVCAQCGELTVNGKTVTEETLVTEAAAHVLSDWQSDETTHWKACTECGEVFRQHSHKDGDGNEACDDCGYNMPAPTEMIPAEEEDKTTFPFLIPVIAAVIIAACTVPVALKKRK